MKKCRFISLIILLLSIILKSQSILNGGFEGGAGSGWTVYSSNGAAIIGTAAFFYSTSIDPPVYPHSGQYMARLGGFSYAVNSLSQDVTLPSTSNVYLHLYYQDRNASTSECAGLWVGTRIKVIIAGQTLTDTYLCYANQTNNWVHVYYDLSAVSGMTINITVRAESANSVWSYLYLDDISISSSATDLREKEYKHEHYSLEQNYPNPFNPITTINYQLPKMAYVSIKVFNAIGRLIETLVQSEQQAGNYFINWDASKYSSGLYYYELIAGEFREVKKMILIK